MSIDIQVQPRSLPRRPRRRRHGLFNELFQWFFGGVLGTTIGLVALRLIDAVPPVLLPFVEFVELQL